MENHEPRVISNREFVGYEEEDIQRLNHEEAEKFEKNPAIAGTVREIEAQLGADGHWEEHWLTLDDSGSRVYARIYYTEDEAVGIGADGQVLRKMDYPVEGDRI